MEQVYRITTHDGDDFPCRKTIGYATGDIEDIRTYFEGMNYGKLFIEPIKIAEIKQQKPGESLEKLLVR